MKRLFFFMAAMLLSSAGAFAQSGKSEPMNGDVNGDGFVDIADVVAVLQIMKDGGGTSGETLYYWYVGQTNPLTMTSISPIVDDNSSPGWRLIGNTLPTYSSSNKLWNCEQGVNIITTGESLAKQYIAIPTESSACPRDGAGNDASTVNIYNRLSDVTISGVEYKVYETVGRMRHHNLDIY